MFIDKFNGVVLIDEDHPLAVAQRAKGARDSADTHITVPAATQSPVPSIAEPPRRKRK
jgi:hypothetical protein